MTDGLGRVEREREQENNDEPIIVDAVSIFSYAFARFH